MQASKSRNTMLAIAALAIAAGWYGWQLHREHQMSQDLFDQPMHTLCVGRYLIDVPAQYVLEYHHYPIDGVSIESLGTLPGQTAFETELSRREAELTTEKNEYEQTSLEKSDPLTLGGSTGKLLFHSRKKPVYWFEDGRKIVTGDGLTGEGWLWLGTYGVSLKGSYRRTDIREMLMKVATPLRPLSADEIPAEPGYCMEMDEGRAFIVGAPLPTQHEATEIQFGLKHHPDVKFRLAMYPNGDKLDESLLVRAKKADAEMSATFMQGVTTLRNGPRTVNALPGEEIVEGVREGFVRTQSMRWETLGKIRDPLYPMINLEGKTGYKGYKHTDSSLSDAQLLKLWDRIVNSIRLRTTSPARHSEAPPPRTPLGALALTGRACPETGWWQCADEGAPVLGGSRQFIRQNEPMPEVVLQGEPSLWQRVKGETPQFRRATVWQLSAYPDDAAATHATAPDTARSNAPQPPADKS